jgi:predicted benzoate:H+ symporter BenE
VDTLAILVTAIVGTSVVLLSAIAAAIVTVAHRHRDRTPRYRRHSPIAPPPD